MHATTYLEARELGAMQADMEWDYLRGWISFPKHAPDIPGHVFDAFALDGPSRTHPYFRWLWSICEEERWNGFQACRSFPGLKVIIYSTGQVQ